ncbi:hydrogenase formation protein HypD [Sedimentibacter sp. B4]|uniref:hydrogenase formation protein HypD n=1 Tax=Sedimentibacter sp. B4 TaxID=304766 RepID=UPI0002FF37B7|nr:hydrogenase formation protein HypD [Sedimentibacter sp. B4]
MDKKIIKRLIDEINFMTTQTQEIKIMEVCGTHTKNIAMSGIKSLLPPNIKLISGPGCPVCVSEESYIDNAIEILRKYNVIIASFGDMIRVSGTNGNLLDEKAKGEDIRIIYSPLELIEMAEQIKNKNIVFLGVGFETTAPVIALTIKKAAERKINNLFFLTSLKLMPPILHYIMGQTINNIDGFICPGHVASVTGSEYFRFIEEEYYLPAAVCGFEAEDILIGIHNLVKQITQKENKKLNNLYTRCVKSNGNPIAKKLINEVFKVSDGEWRGIGIVKGSSLNINENYKKYDALNAFKIENKSFKINTNCQCKEVLLGNKIPKECNLFGKICNPFKPYGPCMVSSEGTCFIAYRYKEEV